MVLGFLFGRAGHNAAPVPTIGKSPVTISNTPDNTQIAVVNPTAPNAIPQLAIDRSRQKYSVPITNEYGQIVAWQTFDNPDQAASFTEDLGKTHISPSTPAAPGQTRLVDQEKF